MFHPDRDPRKPFLVALFVVCVAVLFSIPMLFNYFEKHDASYTMMMSGIVEWFATFVTFSLLSLFAFRETSLVYREIASSDDLRYAFGAFMIVALFAIAAVFRFSESIVAALGGLALWKLLLGFAVGSVILMVRKVPYVGDMLYAATLLVLLGVVAFSCVGVGEAVFPTMIAMLLGLLTHVAVVNVVRVRSAEVEADPVYPARLQDAVKKSQRQRRESKKSEAA